MHSKILQATQWVKTDKVGWWEIWEKQKMQDNYGGGEMGDTGIIDNARMSKVSDG